MQSTLNKAYKGLWDVIDGFANCATTQNHNKESKDEKSIKPSAPTLDYAYPCDNYIDTILSNQLAQQALRKLADKYYSDQIKEIVNNSICLTKTNFPKLWNNYEYCCNKLSVTPQPKVYITKKLTGLNALSVEYAEKQMILLSFKAAVMNKDAEQRFLLGHELGHIQLGHLAAHVVQGLLNSLHKKNELLGPIVFDMIDVPLNRWYRTSEFTADRAGYLCCEDINSINHLFGKMPNTPENTSYIQYKSLSYDHPNMTVRTKALVKFAKQQYKLS